MTVPSSHYRLKSSAFKRNDDENKINPKKMIFLSVEGDVTEKNYFEHLNEHLDKNIIQIEILRHQQGDGYSDPAYVLELLEEYLAVRQGDLIPKDLPDTFINKYTKDFIQKYLQNDSSLTQDEKKQFKEDLLEIGIDIEYRKYLQRFDQDTDYFAVVLDRDRESHSEKLLLNCLKKCKNEGYGFFITNPCFEFWLLLHLCDVKKDFTPEQQKKLYDNKKLSNNHTTVSQEVSKRAHHSKKIPLGTFNNLYYPNISKAMERAKSFSTDLPDLFNNLGSNLPDLLNIICYEL